MSQRASRWMRGIVAALLAGSFGLLGNARPARAASDDFWLSYKEYGTGLWGYRGFWDIDGSEWFATEEVLGYALDEGLMGGYGGHVFGPNDTVTRAQAVTVLWRIAGEQNAQAAPFDDVDYSTTSFYAKAVNWVRAKGISSGYGGANSFGPNDPVTREQLAKLVGELARVEGVFVPGDCDISCFVDAARIPEWALPYMAWCAERGLITGNEAPDGKVADPQGLATRAQLSKIVSVLHRDVLGLGGDVALERDRVAALATSPTEAESGAEITVTGVARRGLVMDYELGRPMPYYYLELGRPLSLDGMPEQNKLLVDSTEYGWGLEWPVPYYSRLGKTITVRTRIVVDPLWETSLLKDIPLICVDEFLFVRTFG